MARFHYANHFVAAILVGFVVSGCQTPNGKWATAMKERSKPKPKFQGLDDKEEVTYWPYKADKSKQKATPMPNQLKEKLARKSEKAKQDRQFEELISQGDQLRKNGQFEDARIAYSQALLASPDSPEVHHRLAIVADKQQQYSAADEHYQAALRSKPRDANLLSDLGYSYYLRGNLTLAEQTLKQALEVNRSHPGAMANLGAVYARQNRADEAMAMFRAGAPEADAQRYFANFFPPNRYPTGNGGLPILPAAHAGPSVASAATNAQPDLTKLSFDQIRAEMARRAEEEKRRRYEADQRELAQTREFSAGQEILRQPAASIATNPYGNQYASANVLGAKNDDDWGHSKQPSTLLTQQTPETSPQAMNPRTASGFDVMRGKSPQLQFGSAQLQPGLSPDPQTQTVQNQQAMNQQAMNQQALVAGGSIPQTQGNPNNALQIATQLGMSAGPGSLFPIVPNSATDGVSVADPSVSYSNRFGGEFQQPSSYQNSQNWNENKIEQASGAASADSGAIAGAPSIAPASPNSNWQSPQAGRLNWQDDSSRPSWINDTPDSGAAGTGLDSGAGQLLRNQSANQRTDLIDKFDSGSITQPRMGTGTETSRPYNGAWPNSSSLPSRQRPGNIVGGASSDGLNGNGNNLPQSVNGTFMSNQPGGTSGPGSNSLPLWRYAPGR